MTQVVYTFTHSGSSQVKFERSFGKFLNRVGRRKCAKSKSKSPKFFFTLPPTCAASVKSCASSPNPQYRAPPAARPSLSRRIARSRASRFISSANGEHPVSREYQSK